MQHLNNSYCGYYYKIAELVAPLIVLYCLNVAVQNRELTNPPLPKLITSSLKQKWMTILSMSKNPFIKQLKQVYAMSKLTTYDMNIA